MATSPDSAILKVTVDTVIPAIPSAPVLLPALETGVSGGIVLSDAGNITFSITDAAPYFRVYRASGDDPTHTYTLVSGDYAAGTLFTDSVQGYWDYVCTAVDAAGNESAPSVPVAVWNTVNFPTPNAPVLEPGSDTGISDTDGVTADGTPSIGIPDWSYPVPGYYRLMVDGQFATADSPSGCPAGTTVTLSVADGVHYVSLVAVCPDMGEESAPSDPLAVTVVTKPWTSADGWAGTQDGNFNSSVLASVFSGWYSEITAVAVQPDGKIVAVGYVANCAVGNTDPFDGIGCDLFVARFDSDGSLDPNFGNGTGVVELELNDGSEAQAVAIEPDGSIIVGGQSLTGTEMNLGHGTIGVGWTSYRLLVKICPTGASYEYLDDGTSTDTDMCDITGVALQPDGEVVAVGDNAVDAYRAERFSEAGGCTGLAAIPSPVPTQTNPSVAIGADGSILIAGTYYGGGSVVLWKLGSDFSPDPVFGGNGTGTLVCSLSTCGLDLPSAFVRSIAIQSGNILVGGESSTTGFLIRLQANGDPDGSFGNGSGGVVVNYGTSATEGTSVSAIAIEPDGDIVLAGGSVLLTGPDFGWQVAALCRLSSNGTPDTSFGNYGWATEHVTDQLRFLCRRGLGKRRRTSDGGRVLSQIRVRGPTPD